MSSMPNDFFISYNKANRAWAEWIAWVVESEGYSSIIQEWDFKAGGNFVVEMDKAMKQSERTIAVLSQDYVDAAYTTRSGPTNSHKIRRASAESSCLCASLRAMSKGS